LVKPGNADSSIHPTSLGFPADAATTVVLLALLSPPLAVRVRARGLFLLKMLLLLVLLLLVLLLLKLLLPMFKLSICVAKFVTASEPRSAPSGCR